MKFREYYIANSWFMLLIATLMLLTAVGNINVGEPFFTIENIISIGFPILMIILSLLLSYRNYKKLKKGGFL